VEGGLALDRPPPAAALVRVPDSLGRRFTVFVDTEEEFDWSAPFSRERHGTEAIAALPALHARLHAAGVKPCYLVDFPVARSRAASAVLRRMIDAGEADLGAQLHPWVTPPFEEALTVTNSFAGALPPRLEAAKLAVLLDALEHGFGRRARIYRAGRYGVGPNTAALLVQAGMRLDVSIRPGFDYSGEGGPDFTGFGTAPFRAGPGGALLAWPAGAGAAGPLARLAPRILPALARRPALRGLLARAGLFNHVPLTPEGVPIREALAAVRAMLAGGVRLLSFSYHSPSAEPGHTPYVRDAADLARFHRWWETMFGELARQGVAPIGAEALLDALAAAPLDSAPAPPLGAAG
jgi:hypothetical protein